MTYFVIKYMVQPETMTKSDHCEVFNLLLWGCQRWPDGRLLRLNGLDTFQPLTTSSHMYCSMHTLYNKLSQLLQLQFLIISPDHTKHCFTC